MSISCDRFLAPCSIPPLNDRLSLPCLAKKTAMSTCNRNRAKSGTYAPTQFDPARSANRLLLRWRAGVKLYSEGTPHPSTVGGMEPQKATKTNRISPVTKLTIGSRPLALSLLQDERYPQVRITHRWWRFGGNDADDSDSCAGGV